MGSNYINSCAGSESFWEVFLSSRALTKGHICYKCHYNSKYILKYISQTHTPMNLKFCLLI